MQTPHAVQDRLCPHRCVMGAKDSPRIQGVGACTQRHRKWAIQLFNLTTENDGLLNKALTMFGSKKTCPLLLPSSFPEIGKYIHTCQWRLFVSKNSYWWRDFLVPTCPRRSHFLSHQASARLRNQQPQAVFIRGVRKFKKSSSSAGVWKIIRT